MASEGPLSPGTVVGNVDSPPPGDVNWTNPGNAAASDNSYATVDVKNADSDSSYLQATNFGFAIPTGATIDGIVVEIERSKSGSGTIRDSDVMLVQAGSIGGTDKAATATNWPSSDAYATYGSSSDLWGRTWTAAQINASNFGVAIYVGEQDNILTTARIDHIRITVYYTPSPFIPKTTFML